MLKVELTHSDIADLAHEMNKDWFGDTNPPSQGGLEWLICLKLRELKGVDFFKEQVEIQGNEDKEPYIC